MNKKRIALSYFQARRAAPGLRHWPSAAASSCWLWCSAALITTLLTGENPINVYGTILKGAFGTVRKSWVTLAERGHPAGHLPGRDARVQDALLEHRRRGSDPHRLSGHRRLHDHAGKDRCPTPC